MTCIVCGSTCEGRERPGWPMDDSPRAFFPVPPRRPRPEAPDHFIEESLLMAVMGVE